MRTRCGDPPNKVCTAVGKLDMYISTDTPLCSDVFLGKIQTVVTIQGALRACHKCFALRGVSPQHARSTAELSKARVPAQYEYLFFQ